MIFQKFEDIDLSNFPVIIFPVLNFIITFPIERKLLTISRKKPM